MTPPLVLSAERVSGGRVRWVVSVRPGRRVTLVTDGVPDITAHATLLTSQIIPALERALAIAEEGP